jgi:hypothetical protein
VGACKGACRTPSVCAAVAGGRSREGGNNEPLATGRGRRGGRAAAPLAAIAPRGGRRRRTSYDPTRPRSSMHVFRTIMK